MRVPDEVFKSVVFLGQRLRMSTLERQKLIGTGFVACVCEAGREYRYLVTARHAVLQLQGGIQEVRANSQSGGGSINIQLTGQWWFHPSEEGAVDVAVTPFIHDDAEIAPIPITRFLTDEDIHEFYVGPGDEVSIAGLFTKFTGDAKNIPIVRRGSIAMLPDAKIPHVHVGDRSTDIDAYLIEVRSVGGLSGSPAFVRAPIGVDYNVHTRSGQLRVARAHFQGDYFFLGLCQGHWEISPDKKNRVDFPIAMEREDSINLGIAIVVPAKRIREVLYHPELVAMRQAGG